ncbi:MAG: hypothetical protein RLP09_24695 [Sandaracinaceae bacterium]
MDVLSRALCATLVALAASGCVFSDRCVNGAARDEASGRCTLTVDPDAGDTDAGEGDAGAGSDAGDASADDDAGVPRRIAQVSVGVVHACAIDDLGVLRCWGDNSSGALATGDTAASAVPRVIDLGAAVTQVGGTALHTCASTSAPATFCWGQNAEGQIGDGTPGDIPTTTPFEITGLGALQQIMGGFANTCAVSLLGQAVCWGRNDRNQLGNRHIEMTQPVPGAPMVEPDGSELEGARQVAIADRHICLRVDGRAYCVGDGGEGSLGDDTRLDRPEPVPVSTLTDVTDVAASFAHSCAVAGGEVFCWGDGTQGQVVPEMTDSYAGPQLVVFPIAAREVVTGEKHSCALLEDGTVHCWGTDDDGALGDAASHTGPTAPVQVEGLSGVTALEANFVGVTCALTGAGELFCWGQDSIELLGGPRPGGTSIFLDGMTRHDTPVRVDPL